MSEDDFSAVGTLEYEPPSVGGRETDFNEIEEALAVAKKVIAQASAERDSAKKQMN